MPSWGCDHNDNRQTGRRQMIKMIVAGTTCTGWSSRGAQRRHDDETMFPFLVFVFCVRWMKPDVCIHECTMMFDVGLLAQAFADSYRLESFIVPPELMGDTVKRNRRYSILINKDTCDFKGSCRDFEEFFAASMDVDGDIYLFADDDMQRPAYRELLHARGCTYLPDGIGGGWISLYTLETQCRKIGYDNEMMIYMNPDGEPFLRI